MVITDRSQTTVNVLSSRAQFFLHFLYRRRVFLVWLPLTVHSERPADTLAKQLQFPEDCGFSTDPSPASTHLCLRAFPSIVTSNLAKAIDEVKANQQLVANKLSEIEKRLATVETRANSVADIERELQVTNEAVGSIAQTNDVLVSRLNDLEDRARKCNLVFFVT
ncbi:hypothetical protein HPB52_006875 [Rhipicephalus sanguineus]|uniref:Uncharacterized protein n=1 Tax=Rhipicephalus sanguineus TaxID=34632 RepID=A0A9D4Q5X2_RHISA|nr:hypothetical protein HPB52_006875 [Rhipicephalus sanguineus]